MTSPTRALAVAALVLAASGCDKVTGGLNSQKGYEPIQPVAYSHATHAGEYQIPCQYCHFGAERSRHAGVPPLNVCMNCHTQVKKDSQEVEKIASAFKAGKAIEWVRVHRLPDFAYFPHNAHIRAKIECQKCHGPIQTMVRVHQVETMSMGWCLDCHRKTEAEGQGLHPPTDCSACHH